MPSSDRQPLAALLREHADGSGGRVIVTEAMQCVARELGRYALHHEGLPPQPLVAFIAGRCGAMSDAMGTFVSSGTSDATASEAQVVGHFRSELASRIETLAPTTAGPVNMGGWWGREGERFVVFAAVEHRRALIQPRSFVPDPDGTIVIDGRLLEASEGVVAYVNHGRWTSETCSLDAGVRLPLFRARCAVAPGDAVAAIEVTATPPGRLLGHAVFSTIVGAGRATARVFEVAPNDPAHEARDAAQSRDVLISLLNGVRRSAGVEPVTLAEREADSACAVAPAFFAAATDPSEAHVTDQVALGMMAGWDVEGPMIREGRFFMGHGANETNLARWIEWTMDHPLGRRVLLDRDVRQVAVCPYVLEGRVHGVLWSSYGFYDDTSLGAETSRVHELLDRARQHVALAPAVRLTDLQSMMESEAAALRTGTRDPDAILHAMIERAVAARETSFRGYVLATSDLDSIHFPDPMLGNPAMRVAVHVGHWRAPGAAWGELVVFMLVEA